MTALQKEYSNLKFKYPDAVIWFYLDGFIETFSDCALTTSSVLQLPLTNRSDNGLMLCGFTQKFLEANIKKMVKAEYTVVILDKNNQLNKQ